MFNTVVIAEDDLDARKYLKLIIECVSGFEVVGEASNGHELVQLTEKLRPDVIFLDVRMPKMDGVEAANEIMDINPLTIFVFSTAYNEYMSEAFDLYAFDYITKPLDESRVINTLKRIKMLQKRKTNRLDNTEISYQDNKILLQCDEGLAVVYQDEIIFISREGRKTVLYTVHGQYTTSEPLQDIEKKLNDKLFMRTHRSYIVNVTMVSRIIRWTKKTYTILFRHIPEEALLTSDRLEEIKNIMK
jgi:two-component system LytT family response regulator